VQYARRSKREVMLRLEVWPLLDEDPDDDRKIEKD
jgi:hypothetical protein